MRFKSRLVACGNEQVHGVVTLMIKRFGGHDDRKSRAISGKIMESTSLI